jgi:hypothetical protein
MTKIVRFHNPELHNLSALKNQTANLRSIQIVLQSHYKGERTHEEALQECDRLLGTSGVASLDIDESHHTDEGVRMCPPFSYANVGDPYIPTLIRDHANQAWIVGCWAEVVEEYEQENNLGDYEVFEECPEVCPNCDEDHFTLKHFVGFSHGMSEWQYSRLEEFGSPRGPSYSWVCQSCNQHCFAEDDAGTIQVGETDDFEPVYVRALKVDEIDPFNGTPTSVVDGPKIGVFEFQLVVGELEMLTYETPQEAKDAWGAILKIQAGLDSNHRNP